MGCGCGGTESSGPSPIESGSSYTSISGSSLYKGGKKHRKKVESKRKKQVRKRQWLHVRRCVKAVKQ